MYQLFGSKWHAVIVTMRCRYSPPQSDENSAWDIIDLQSILTAEAGLQQCCRYCCCCCCWWWWW